MSPTKSTSRPARGPAGGSKRPPAKRARAVVARPETVPADEHSDVETVLPPESVIDLTADEPAVVVAPAPGTSGAPAPRTFLRSDADLGDADQKARPIAARTLDDTMSVVGAALGSLAFVWLVYDRLLPFSGPVGFVVCWFVAFVVFYAGVTAVTQSAPAVRDRASSAVVQGGAGLIGIALVSIVVYIFYKGHAPLEHWSFYSQDESKAGPLTPLGTGGCLHAVVGTLIEIGIAVAVTLPLGVGTAVFMSEVGGRGSTIVRTIVEAMTALPSIVAGLFIYTVLIIYIGFPKTGFAGSMAMSVMMLPIIARAADVVLRVVSGGLREASLALGASRWQTVWRVVLPTARNGLGTALILGVARGIGETSPVLLTAGESTYMNTNPFKNQMNSLPLYIYQHVRSAQTVYIERGYGAAAVLLIVVGILFVATRLLAKRGAASR